MRGAVIVALLGLLWSASASGATVIPIIEGPALGAEIRDLRPPETLRKDLVSGLTNRVLIQVTLTSGSESLGQRVVELTVRYDLWDEVFRLHTLMDGTTLSAATVKSAEEAMAFLRNVRLARLFVRSVPPRAQALILKAEVLLNPIEREQLDSIKKWVRQNTAPAPSAGGGLNPGGGTSSNPHAIFNRIFEQYATGAEFAASWKEELTSQPFSWEPVRGGN